MQQKSDNVVSHYVFEAPVRIWHWLTVLCMAVLIRPEIISICRLKSAG